MNAPAASSAQLTVVELDARELDGSIDHLAELHDRRADVLLLSNVFTAQEMALVAARFNSGECADLHDTVSEKFRFYSLGRCLDMMNDDLRPYFAQMPRFRERCESVFRDTAGYEARVSEVIHRLGGARPTSVPAGPRGEAYMPSTIRHLPSGGYIPPHCEREQLERPAYHHLKGVIDPLTMTSFYVPLSYGEGGGEIVVYGFEWSDVQPHMMSHGRSNVESFIDRCPSTAFRPPVGGMIVFDGGRLFHRVTPVVDGDRWTIGGFLAASADRARIHFRS